MRYGSKIDFHNIGPAGHRQLQILVRCKLALSRENLPSGFPARACSNHPPQLHRLAKILKLSTRQACLDIISCRERITKALTSLRIRAGWSASLFYACNTVRFSRVVAHMIITDT